LGVALFRRVSGVRQFGVWTEAKRMNITRWMTVAALGMLSCTWAQADSAHFLINLEGWDSPQEFTFIPNQPIPDDLSPCLPAGDICGDASIRINSGGGSPPIPGEFTFNSDQVDANGDIFFQNDSGVLFSTVEITVTLNADEVNDPFSCFGGNIFQQCGFLLNNNQGIETLDTFFYNPFTQGGGIPSATPEPSQWIILMLAFLAIIVVRSRKAIANSFFAQTQRSVCSTRDS
jgi:hypothetical protein